MVNNAGKVPSLMLGWTLAMTAASTLMGGCASDDPLVRPSDCVEVTEKDFLGFFKSLDSSYNETCADARYVARFLEALENAKTSDKALAAFYTMMERNLEGSDEKRAEFDKFMIRHGFDPKRIEAVSRLHGPAKAGLRNCPEATAPNFQVEGRKTIVRLGCFEAEGGNQASEEIPALKAPPPKAPAIAAP